jgi:hypothetical protein
LDADDSFVKKDNIIECASGEGAIVKILQQNGFSSIDQCDIKFNRNYFDNHKKYHQAITNPPFKLAFEFIQHSKEIILNRFALLLPLSYLHGKTRYDRIWTDKEYPLAKVYAFTRYILFGDPLREDGKYGTGMVAFGWYVWDKEWQGEPIIRWIDNQKFVLSKKDR